MAIEEIEPGTLSRRQFLGRVAAGTLVVAVPVTLTGRAARAATAGDAGIAALGGTVGAYILIGADETVTIVGPNSEMGQGTSSALPQILAEELMVDWAKVRMRLADADPAFANPMFGSQATGGSTAVRAYYPALRKAGAQAREMLVAAAMADTTIANLGGLARDKYVAQSGVVRNTVTNASATYGQLAAAAGAITPPPNPPLLAPNPPRLIGQPLQRLDIPAKVDGSAVFGIDVRLPDMVYAAVRLAPKVGQSLGTVGAAPAGVQVVRLSDPSGTQIGIAAITTGSTWNAIRAVRALSVTWVDASYTAATDTATMKANAQNLLATGTPVRWAKSGNPLSAIGAAAKTVTATYSAPFLAHATMEPLNATVKYVAGTSCEVWAPTQNQSGCVAVAKALTGLSDAQVTVHTTFLGGGLGRKYETDFVHQAVQVAMAKPGVPVKFVWPREEDFSHDVYRPAALCKLTAGLDGSGNPVGIVTRSVCQALYGAKGWLAPGSIDPPAIEGLVLDDGQDTVAYSLGSSQLVEWVYDTTSQVPIGFWRSVGHSFNVFFLESFLDEMAKAAAKNPMDFRMAMLPATSREYAVLQTLKTASAWTTKVSGVGKGVAIARSFGGTIVAAVAEVSGTATAPKVGKITAVIDCGTVINPDTVKAQVESAVIQGFAAAMWQDMPFTLGTPARKNFGAYRMPKMSEIPVINVTIMPGNGNPPGGVGEPALPAVAPAIGNAIAALTGTRLRSLPFIPQAVPAV